MGLLQSKELFPEFDKNLPNVNGKVFVITGTTSGTGFIAAETVAKHGGEVLLLNRPSSRSISSLEKLQTTVPKGKFVPIDCDLQDFESVRAAVTEIKAKGYTSIYCLSNNAGIMAVPDEITKTDKCEKQMQTNHLSHFLLTKELFPLIVNASKQYGDARIVQHSSAARHGRINGLEEKYFSKQEKDGMLGGDDPNAAMFKGAEWERYSQTKLANSVFSKVLHDKLLASENEDCKNILSVCAHPGGSRTNLGDHLGTGFFMTKVLMPIFNNLVMQSAADGSMGLLRGMMDYKKNLVGGTLYGPAFTLPKKQSWAGLAVPNPPAPYEVDPKAKEMLWRASETATGVTFDV